MTRKKVLLISYYWPPAGGGGVQRWLKMSKYFDQTGYDLWIYTPENGESPVEDVSLVKEIRPEIKLIKTPIWEPYSWYKKFTGKKSNEKVYSGFINEKKESPMQKLSVFIRGNFFIPDARKFWIKPSIKFLRDYLTKNPVDLIISTGPPHSMHMIALGVAPRLKIPWIADFRDPWTNIDFYDQLRLTSWADQKHRKMEKSVLTKADEVVTVSPSWAKEFEQLSGRNVHVITNGFDPADFNTEINPQHDTFSILHIGSMNKDRDPGKLWEALRELIDDGKIESPEIRLIGQVDHSIFASMEKKGLTRYLKHEAFKQHDAVIQDLQKATILLLPINDTPNSSGVIPGKLFEYIGSGSPILGIGPIDGDSAQILRETHAGVMINYSNKLEMKKQLVLWYEKFKKGESLVSKSESSQYSRRNLALQYGKLIDSVLN